MNYNYICKKFFIKNQFFLNFSKNIYLEDSNFVILHDGLRDTLNFITLCNLNLYKFKILNYNSKQLYKNILFINMCKIFNYNIGLVEYDLKGVNYWFSLLKDIIFLDLGKSHFQLINFYFNHFFFKLKKKWLKRLTFISFNKSWTNLISNFFWFKLKKVGPYKLKGFQFINEWITLKAGKKPFK